MSRHRRKRCRRRRIAQRKWEAKIGRKRGELFHSEAGTVWIVLHGGPLAGFRKVPLSYARMPVLQFPDTKPVSEMSYLELKKLPELPDVRVLTYVRDVYRDPYSSIKYTCWNYQP